MTKAATPLRDELEHWNEVTSMRYLQCLESVTALALEDAGRHLSLFSNMLSSSMQFVEQRIEDINVEADNENSDGIRMIQADHMILGRTCKMAEQALEELCEISESKNLRAEMVQRLDIFVRLNNILRQHQRRQQESLFPLLENTMDAEQEQSLTDVLTRAMQRSRPH